MRYLRLRNGFKGEFRGFKYNNPVRDSTEGTKEFEERQGCEGEECNDRKEAVVNSSENTVRCGRKLRET